MWEIISGSSGWVVAICGPHSDIVKLLTELNNTSVGYWPRWTEGKKQEVVMSRYRYEQSTNCIIRDDEGMERIIAVLLGEYAALGPVLAEAPTALAILKRIVNQETGWYADAKECLNRAERGLT